MYELNLGFENILIYRGCKITPIGENRYRLDTPIDSAVVILGANLLGLLEAISKSKRDLLVLTGAVPTEIYMTAQSVLGPFFKEVERFNGTSGVRVRIPQPPANIQCEPE